MAVEKRPFLPLLLLTLLLLATLFATTRFLYLHYPHFARYPDTTLTQQSWRRTFSPTLCLATVSQIQTLTTSRNDGTIWQRLPAVWFQPQSGFYGYGNEAYFERRLGGGIKLGASVFYNSNPPQNSVYVNNNIAIQLPPRLCRPFS